MNCDFSYKETTVLPSVVWSQVTFSIYDSIDEKRDDAHFVVSTADKVDLKSVVSLRKKQTFIKQISRDIPGLYHLPITF